MGYAGGTAKDPTYRRLGDHTETIRIVFDPVMISYVDLLGVFFDSHDATWRPQGRQYMSLILTSGDEQAFQARAALAATQKVFGGRVATVIAPLDKFTPAEDYHQKYYLRNVTDLFGAIRPLYPDERSFVLSTAAARVNGYLGGNGSPERLAAELPLLGLPAPAARRLSSIVARIAGSDPGQ